MRGIMCLSTLRRCAPIWVRASCAVAALRERVSDCWQVAAEESWQRLLVTVRQALGSGRRMLWDDAARRLAVLLTAPAAFAAEHFTQACSLTVHV